MSLRKFQELNAAFARTPAPLQASQLASSSSSSPVVWALAFLRGNRPVSVEDSAGSLETAIALAYGLLLPPDMIKEKESSLDRLERTAVLHGIRVRYFPRSFIFSSFAFSRYSNLHAPFLSLFKRWWKYVRGPVRGMRR